MQMVGEIGQLRHDLHRLAEVSGAEYKTLVRLKQFFQACRNCELLDIADTGLLVIFAGRFSGPTVLLRADMDAVPVAEQCVLPYASENEGVAHKCGHDGHMAILAAVGLALEERLPSRGRVMLLFQPAEETGAGAEKVLLDQVFCQFQVDYAFALHNLPGYPLGQVVVRDATFCCASRGMSVVFLGLTAHAAQPETGKSPALAMCKCIEQIPVLARTCAQNASLCMATVVGARLGAKSFGLAPGRAEIWVTLRTEEDEKMAELVRRVEEKAHEIAENDGLQVTFAYSDIFSATVNSAAAVACIRGAAAGQLLELEHPFRWSEDFGKIADGAEYGAIFGLGAGERHCDLHDQEYDFPDELLPLGRDIFLRILDQVEKKMS